MKYRIHLLTALLLLLSWGQMLHAQCENDTEAPVLSTITGLQATLPETTGIVEIFASDFVAEVSDNCTEDPDLTLTVEGIPAGESYTFSSPGTYAILVQARDAQGNVTENSSTLIIDGSGPAGCDPDETQPNIICYNNLEIVLSSETGIATLAVDDLVEDASDNCSDDVDVYMTFPGAPMVDTYSFSALGNYPVTVTVQDLAGNTNFCTTSVVVVEEDVNDPCQNDTEVPLIHCLTGLVAELQSSGEVEVWAQDFIDVLTDNCTSESEIEVSIMLEGDTEESASLTFTEPGQYPIVIIAEDQAGNTTSCNTYVVVEEDLCENDVQAPTFNCIAELVVVIGPSGESEVFADHLVGSIEDNCSAVGNIEVLIHLEGTADTTDALTFTQVGNYYAQIFVTDEAGNSGSCTILFEVITFEYNRVHGQVFTDFDDNCTLGPGESTWSGWPVTIQYALAFDNDTTIYSYTYVTDENGGYEAFIIANDPYSSLLWGEISVDANGSSGSCPNSYTFGSEVFADTNEVRYDLEVHLLENCYSLNVDISSLGLRRCFTSNYYVNVCNTGTEPAEDATIVVGLDELLEFQSSTIPVTNSIGQFYTFDIGDVGSGECIQFRIEVEVSCEALLGQTHCSAAAVTPVSPCNNPEAPQLLIEGECVGDEVVFRITNNSEVDMQEHASYTVVEDVIMYLQDSVKLNGNESKEVIIPANGSTYYMELEDPEPGSLEVEGLAIEACGTNENGGVSLGFVTQYPFNSPIPEVDIDCQENVGSFDPNDKQAWPLGTGEDHRIRPGTKLDYMIRFQNTGTDTAFNVVIKDTLSPYLNIATVKAGASSHPFRFNTLDGNVLQFSFDNIALPDSNINEPASHGFVKFSIEQMPDNPLGEEILNSAAIYFDFNEPVITNTVSRLLSEEVVVVSVDEPTGIHSLPTTVFPNPFTTQTTIQVQGLQTQNAQLHLYHSNGKHLKTQTLENSETQLMAGDLSAGLYFFTITSDGQTVSRGKVVVR